MCIAVTKKGTQCTYAAKFSDGMCARHHNIHNSNEPVGVCVTITFGDVAENHVGMQAIGTMRDCGFTCNDLAIAKLVFESKGYACEHIDLTTACDQSTFPSVVFEEASVLVIRNFTRNWSDELLQNQINLPWDTKAKMRGRVVNKHARYNLCYSDMGQSPDYDNGKGTIIPYTSLPKLSQVRSCLNFYLGNKALNLNAEGNMYYDISKCGIGWHGDAERKVVIALRLGKEMPLAYQWYLESNPIGSRVDINLKHGDMYVMSEKATGFDWKKRKTSTLRHSAGCRKYTGIG